MILRVETADTSAAHERGLMFRESLDNDAGMLFRFPKPITLKFWGANTFLPLDIAFIDQDQKIVKIDRIKPMSMKTVSSDCRCLYAVEANEGFFGSHGIKSGYKVEAELDRNGETVLKFSPPKG